MAFASLFLPFALCLLASGYTEAEPRRSPAAGGSRPNYADCPIGDPTVMGTINGDGSVPEASGLAYSRRQEGVMWTFNDSGGANKIFAISEQGEREVQNILYYLFVKECYWISVKGVLCERRCVCLISVPLILKE